MNFETEVYVWQKSCSLSELKVIAIKITLNHAPASEMDSLFSAGLMVIDRIAELDAVIQ